MKKENEFFLSISCVFFAYFACLCLPAFCIRNDTNLISPSPFLLLFFRGEWILPSIHWWCRLWLFWLGQRRRNRCACRVFAKLRSLLCVCVCLSACLLFLLAFMATILRLGSGGISSSSYQSSSMSGSGGAGLHI